jgi:hypothetical protein
MSGRIERRARSRTGESGADQGVRPTSCADFLGLILRALALAGGLAALLGAQQFQFNLDRLAAKASDTVDLALNGATLQFAAKFLDTKNPDEAKVKKLIAGLEGIYIKTFEFKRAGEWSEADLEGIRKQLHAPEWSRIVGVKSTEDGETAEIYLRNENGKVTGLAILASEPKELTVVNIAGAVDLDSLADLGGHFGIPKVEIGKQK